MSNVSLFHTTINTDAMKNLCSWAGPVLQDMHWHEDISSIMDLDHCIIFVDGKQANWRYNDIVRLSEQGNFLVFCCFYESYITSQPLRDLLGDFAQQSDRWAVIGNGRDPDPDRTLDLDEFFFLTHTNANRMISDRIWNQRHRVHRPYTMLFLNGLMGQSRQHRAWLWHELNGHRALDRALWSVLDPGQDEVPVQYLPASHEHALVRQGHDVSSLADYKRLHWGNENWIDGQLVERQYSDTYFSVVSETSVQGAPFFTEKIYKTLLAGHPFVLAAPPGSYQELHDRGFRTFDGLIDESFDSEPDARTRMAMIARSVSAILQGDLDQFWQAALDICEHNRRWYIDSQWDHWMSKHRSINSFLEKIMHWHDQN